MQIHNIVLSERNKYKYLQTLHIHFFPFQFLIAFLYSSRCSQFLMCPGSEFQILEPSEVKLFVPKVVWFGLGVFKLCCC